MTWYTANEAAATGTSNLASDAQPVQAQTYANPNISAEVNMGDTPMAAESGVMASARTSDGSPIVGRALQGSDQVSVEGMPMAVTQAVQLGYMVRNGDGSFSDAKTSGEAAPTNAQPQVTQEAATGEPEVSGEGEVFSLGSVGEQHFDALIQNVPQDALVSAMNGIIMSGGRPDGIYENVARASGMELADATQMVDAAADAMVDAATNRLEAFGVTSQDAFEAFVKSDLTNLSALQNAARDLATANDTTGIDALAAKFVENADQVMQDEVLWALEEADIPHRVENGRVIVTQEGNEMSYQNAVRTGIIKVSRNT